MANLRMRVGSVTAWKDNRIIHSDIKITKVNQFYCQRCKRSHSDLVVYEGETYCSECVPISKEEYDKLPVYGQCGRRLK